MKKKITLLMMALLLAVGGVQAARVKTVEFKLNDANFVVSYTGTNSVSTETGELSLDGNASCAWDRFYASPKYDLSTSDFFVVKLKEAATQDLFVLINQKGFWETVGADSENADHGIGYCGTLKAGQTELRISLAGLKSNMSVHSGTTLDLSNIWMINLWTGGSGGACTYMIEEVYAEKYTKNYDQVIETKIWDKTSFSWEGENNAKAEWGGENMTIDKTNKKITKTNGAWEGNNAVAWLNYEETDISGYDRLVLELDEASNGPVEVVVSDGGFWGGKCHSAILATGETELILTLSELTITGTPGEEETWKKGDPLDLEHVNLIFIRTDNGTANQVIDVKDFYFAKLNSTEYSLIRENMTSGKYGTICLPFAATADNATIYEVAGVDSKATPSKLYLNEVAGATTAGRAYLYKSTSTDDITFTKSGTDANLNDPVNESEPLQGVFGSESYVPENGYILNSNKFYKVTVADQNKVKNYRAYLDLENVSETSGSARQFTVMDFETNGETTGVQEVKNSRIEELKDCFNLAGQRVAAPQKGLYIVNGKKVIINK